MAGILVIGATGQLGLATVHKLRSRGTRLRALVRSAEAAERFRSLGVEHVAGDLTDSASLDRACEGMNVVVATANAAVPTRPTDSFEAVERIGYRNLIKAAVKARMDRFVYTSAALTRYEHLSPLIRFKRETESSLAASGLETVVFRADVFMDVAFTMMGSTIPIRGAEGATVLRPCGFVASHLNRIKDDIEQRHMARIPGNGDTRHAFICVDNVAEYLATAAISGPSGTFDACGPEALTFLDVVRIYERILGVALRVQKTPPAVFRVAASVMRPFTPAGANLMALNYIACKEESLPNPAASQRFGIRLTTAETFLRRKSVMAAYA
jgi:NADH dehydrogenase